MKLFNLPTISARIIGGYLILLVAIFVLVLFSLYQLERVNYIATEIEVNWLPATRTLGDINKGLSELRITEYRHIASDSQEEMDVLAKNIDDRIRTIQEERALYEPLIVTPEEKDIYDAFCSSWNQYLEESRPITATSSNRQKGEALSRINARSQTLYGEMNSYMEKLIDINEQGGIETSHRGDSILALSTFQIITMGVFALIVGIVICVFMTYFLITNVSVTRKYKFISEK